MKKVLHLTNTDIEFDSRILKEMGALAEAGYDVSGLGVIFEQGARTIPAFESKIQAICVKSKGWKFLPKTIIHMMSLCELIIKMLPSALRQRPDIVHCHDVSALPLGFAVKLFTGAKLIYDAHELESDRNGLSRLQGMLILSLEKILWRFVDSLIVVSPSIDLWYQKHLGPKRSVVIFNSPLISSTPTEGRDYLRNKFFIPIESKIFIYIGILGKGRGIDLLTEAFKLQDFSSHIVFLGYGELSTEIKTLASLYPNIHLHDPVPHAQVVPIAQSADYGLCLVEKVSLSDYYCLPNKLFEYCFAGIPVLASDFPDIHAVLSQHGIGKCCNLEVDSIREAACGMEASEYEFQFRDLYSLSWQAQEKKLLDLYNQTLS